MQTWPKWSQESFWSWFSEAPSSSILASNWKRKFCLGFTKRFLRTDWCWITSVQPKWIQSKTRWFSPLSFSNSRRASSSVSQTPDYSTKLFTKTSMRKWIKLASWRTWVSSSWVKSWTASILTTHFCLRAKGRSARRGSWLSFLKTRLFRIEEWVQAVITSLPKRWRRC